MTTLQVFGGGPSLCLPKPKHYKFILILIGYFFYGSVLGNTISSIEESSETSTFFTPDTLRMDTIIRIATDTIPDTVVIADCGLNIRFQDDNSFGSQYKDNLGEPRNSILTFCPPDGNSNLTFNFSAFSLEAGDTLCVYEGIIDHNILEGGTGATPPFTGSGSSVGGGIGTGSGSSVGATPPFFEPLVFITKGSGEGAASFNGGWVAANCDRTVNPSGCITFHFKTDGDNNKGTGWDASIRCQDRTTTIMPPDAQFVTLSCGEIKTPVTIGAGKIVTRSVISDNFGHTTECTIANDSLLIKIINGEGRVCMDTCIREDSTFVIDTLAIGTYTVHYSLKVDSTVSAENYLAISPPVMVCNDNVRVALGAGCSATIRPDMLLENPCDTINDTLYYNMVVTRPNGDTIATGTSKNGAYPWVRKDSVDVCGDINYLVELTRVYDYGTEGACCNQGQIKDVCWGYVSFVDEAGPTMFSNIRDTVIACDLTISHLDTVLQKPIVVDNCDSVNIHLFDLEPVRGDKCDPISTYLAVWRAEDQCGNPSILRDTLWVKRPTIEDFRQIKLPNIELRCGIDDDAVIDDLTITGSPKLVLTNDTMLLTTDSYTCDLILLKEDRYFPHPGGIKLFRFWSISDRCAPRPVPIVIDTQLIEFIDTLIPTLVCPPHSELADAEKFPLDPLECTLDISIAPPHAVDLCDPSPKVEMRIVEQLKHGQWDSIAPNLIEAGDLIADTFRVSWNAHDNSGNKATNICYRYFILQDLTPPSAICKDELNVSFGEGVPTITVDEIDDISWDACGILRREVRRTGEEIWSEQVTFECEDVYDPVRVELRVTDVTGNQNVCWLFVDVLDNVRPICETLPDTTAFCDDFFTGELGEPTDIDGDTRLEDSEWQPLTGDLLALYNARFGTPTCLDNVICRQLSTEQEYQIVYNQCGEATARRRYRGIDTRQPDQASPWQVQFISVDYRPDWAFTLPVDWAGECGDDLPDPFLAITRGACDVLAWEHEDQIFDIVEDACFQINRTYYIINWCTYQQGMEPLDITRIQNIRGDVVDERVIDPTIFGNFGYFKYTQVLKVSDSNEPIVTINPVQTCIYGAGDVAPIGSADLTPGASPYECDTIRVFSAEATDCEDAFFSNFSFEWWIYEDGVESGHGDTKKFFWTVQPKIDYTVKYRVYDNCGNFGEKEENFQFWDCTRPTILCQDSVTTSIRTSGTALISPAIIASQSYDNCTPSGSLDYRIWHSSFSNDGPRIIDDILELPNALEMGCNYEGVQRVRVYILDAEDNYSSCVTNVIITDSNNQCTHTDVLPRLAVAGNIKTEDGVEVESVDVQVAGGGTMPSPYRTSTDGNYQFELDNGQDYMLTPKKDINPLNGVSTFDLVLISKHILAIESIASPYHLIAADINRSGSITAFDMVQLRQLILNIVTDFPNNDSWRFVDATYEFTTDDPLTEPFREAIAVNLNGADQMDNDFIAIKIGDVSGNATPNNLVVAEERTTQESFSIQIEEQFVKKGETFTVALQADIAEIEGYQFALSYKDAEFLELTEGIIKKEHIGQTMLDRHILPISWNATQETLESTGLLALTFKATKSANVSELLAIHPTILQAEAYNLQQELMQVDLQFLNKTTQLEVLQNRPNPFKGNTTIGFHLPKAEKVQLSILTMDGKTIQEWSQYFEQGYNEWMINSQDLPERGVLYYQMRTNTELQTKKMIVLE